MPTKVPRGPIQPETSAAAAEPARSRREPASPRPSVGDPAPAGRQTGYLAELSAMVNQSPRVQTQLKLAGEIQESSRVQGLRDLAAEINHGPPPVAQELQQEESGDTPAQRKEAPAPNHTGLPDQLKAGVENLSGVSLDNVQVHYNSAQPAQLNALAYAQGTDIHVAPGQERHLPHEAWHVVQQAQGRVRPTMQMKDGVPVNDDHGLEHEADVMGAKAAQSGQSASPSLFSSDGADSAPAQRSPAGETLHPGQGHNPVQKKVGFEFEVEAPLYTKGEKQDMLGEVEKVATTFTKADKIYSQPGFHVVQDHAAGPVSGNIRTIPEFVVHPAEESLPKDAFLSNVKAAKQTIESLNYPYTLDLGKGVFAGDNVVGLTPNRQGTAQATFGIHPEGVGKLFKGKQKRFTQPSVLSESQIVEGANAAALEVIKLPVFNDVETNERGRILGFLQLICMYCVSNSLVDLQKGAALDKNKVPFLVRSTMGAVAKATLSTPSLELLHKKAGPLTEAIMKITKANYGTPIIFPTSSESKPVKNVNAEEWVFQALQGTDKPLKWGSETDYSDSVLIAPEKVGSLPDNSPQDNRSFGAVVEERHLVQGQVLVKDWEEAAGKVWEYVRKANGIS